MKTMKFRSLNSLPYALWGGIAFLANILLILPVQDMHSFLAVGYLLQVATYTALNQSRHKYALIRLLQPSMISLIYIGLSCSIGSWAFYSGNVVNILGASFYNYWPNLKQVYILLSSCFFVLYLISLRSLKFPCSDVPRREQFEHYGATILFAISLLFICLLATTMLTFSVLSQLKTVIAAALVYILFRYNVKGKWMLVALVVGILAATSAHSKREAIFTIPAIFLMALAYQPMIKMTLKNLFFGFIVIITAICLILAMSILRGYGDFGARNVVDAIIYIPQYLKASNSLALMMNNFEISYIFLHLHNCMSAALHAPADLAYGETYIRVFFIWPIGDAIGYKPASIIDQYTGTFFPSFRDEGGSFGVTSIGEAVWNFGNLAPLAIFPIYFVLDSFFSWIINIIRNQGAFGTIFALNSFQYLLYYSRGSGFDIVIIYALFSVFCGLGIALALKMLGLDIGRNGFARSGDHVTGGGKVV